MKQQITSDAAPAAVGPYSQGIAARGELVFVSGQLPIDVRSGAMPNTVEEQAEQSLQNVQAVLEAAELSLKDVVKTTVFLQDMGAFAQVNEVYARFFEGTVFPARVAIEVAKLPLGALVEIEAIAVRK
ncbi:MAG: Rid family detoxifying hydrolase [Arcanobacterium sp.]|nr:Rid family detoxifying hydrolase [Arcanobacterium sp.]MDY5589504.1 Rid family detoxifying hydrolase [Arcanobacterium sp.]